jgi:hypothetical protein
VVIHDFDALRPRSRPNEAHAPLVIDADAVLSGSVPAERFETIARGRAQVLQLFGSIKHLQFSFRDSFNVPESLRVQSFVKGFGVFAPK